MQKVNRPKGRDIPAGHAVGYRSAMTVYIATCYVKGYDEEPQYAVFFSEHAAVASFMETAHRDKSVRSVIFTKDDSDGSLEVAVRSTPDYIDEHGDPRIYGKISPSEIYDAIVVFDLEGEPTKEKEAASPDPILQKPVALSKDHQIEAQTVGPLTIALYRTAEPPNDEYCVVTYRSTTDEVIHVQEGISTINTARDLWRRKINGIKSELDYMTSKEKEGEEI